MKNEFATMTKTLINYFYCDYYNTQYNLFYNQENFDAVIMNIPGFEKHFDSVSTRSIPQALTEIVNELHGKLRHAAAFNAPSTRNCIAEWRSGNSDMVRYFIHNNTKTHHIVNFLSALNYKFNCFSVAGDDFGEHIVNVSRFLGSFGSAGGNKAAAVMFYPRSLNDIALMFTVYTCGTNEEFKEIANRLNTTLVRAMQDAKGRSKTHEPGNTLAIKDHVIYKIFNAYYCDVSCCGEDRFVEDMMARKERALVALERYIEMNPYYFSNDFYYSVIEQAMQWLINESAVIGHEGVLRFLPKELVCVFADPSVPYSRKNDCAESLYNELLQYIYTEEGCPEVARKIEEKLNDEFAKAMDMSPNDRSRRINNIIDHQSKRKNPKYQRYALEDLFGISSGSVNFTAHIVFLLRYSIAITLANYYLSLKSRPEDKASRRGEALVERINSVYDELGFAHINYVRSNSSELDWYLYRYITDERIKSEADKSLREVEHEK